MSGFRCLSITKPIITVGFMKKDIELLAPGGDLDSIKAAILGGADAIYCGLNRFNARNRAANISLDELYGVLRMAHKNSCKVFLTLNIIIIGSEIPSLIGLLNNLVNTGIDGVIVQDFGLFYLLSRYFKNLKIHASTQLTTHNEGQIRFLKKLNANRVNISRELNLNEIQHLTLAAHEQDVLTEVFVHGSYCISFSGICYLSSIQTGSSGNRGRCSQPCRHQYFTTPQGKNYPLNLKDNSVYHNLKEIYDAGVDSLKIEGRIKGPDYVYTVVNCWKKQIKNFFNHNTLGHEDRDLYKVFNRDFSNGYLMGNIDKEMFIDNPRDNSVKHLVETDESATDEEKGKRQSKIYEIKDQITADVKDKVSLLSISKEPLLLAFSGGLNTPMRVSVKTPDTSFVVESEGNLVNAAIPNLPKPKTVESLNHKFLLAKFNNLNSTGYYIQELDLENLEEKLFLSFKDLSSIKKRILSTLTGSRDIIEPIEVPFLTKQKVQKHRPLLSVLISSKEDLKLCNESCADIFYQIPNAVDAEYHELIEIFYENKKLLPWFPSILIKENYSAAKYFLDEIQPGLIVSNNTGLAYEAYKRGIPWIAGPYLNIVNSFSLLCLKKKFNCSGAFISGEISKKQINVIIRPKDFKLYYSIYHPILLLTSRQCLHQQVIGCAKSRIDNECLKECNKSSSITNLKNDPLLIKKTKGNYHSVYHHHNFLNTDIVADLPGFFSNLLIDLREIETETMIKADKSRIIRLFDSWLNKDADSEQELRYYITPTTDRQYRKGI